MPSTLIDSTILGNLVGTEAMRALFSDDNRTQRYLDVEAALARVQGQLGVIPKPAAAEIERNCRVDRIDMAKLRAQTERAGSPIVGVVQQLGALCAEPHGRYCHWGATTQDITDTATVLQMRDALALIDIELAAVADALAGLALRYRDTPMAGRSHLQ
jgi:3-carboxy-cis,cis-muconate cycloisomerase